MKQPFSNRRGSVSNQSIRFIIGTIYLIAVITAVSGLIILNTPTEVDITTSELNLFALRLLHEPSLAWVDPLLHHQRSGIIDHNKLTIGELRHTIQYPPGRIAARINIENHELYYDKPLYRRLIEQIGIKGGPAFSTITVPIIIRDGMTDRSAIAEINMVQT